MVILAALRGVPQLGNNIHGCFEDPETGLVLFYMVSEMHSFNG